jgi:hypothetical protein
MTIRIQLMLYDCIDFYAENCIVRIGYGCLLLLVFASIFMPTFAWKSVPLFFGNDLLPALLQSALSSANACVCSLNGLMRDI